MANMFILKSHKPELQVSGTENQKACGSIAVTSALEIMYNKEFPIDYMESHLSVSDKDHGSYFIDVFEHYDLNYFIPKRSCIKKLIKKGKPVLISMKYSTWNNAMSNNYEDQQFRRFYDFEDYTNHAMLIVGYHDKGFIVQNSLGNDWGVNGTFIVPFDVIFDKEQTRSVYAIHSENYF